MDEWLMLEFVALRDIQPGEEVLINYGDEWQKAWDEHVKNWEPIPVESDYNNLTLWAKPGETNNGKTGYVRAEELNNDIASGVRTVEEQIKDPYPKSVLIQCKVNVNHDTAYLYEPLTVPTFSREWEAGKDDPTDKDDVNLHNCKVTGRHLYESEDSGDEVEDEGDNYEHKYVYTVEVEVTKKFDDFDPIVENHEIENVPFHAIIFKNMYYTSDVFLKNSFRHTMKLPNEIFPKAWKNIKSKKEKKSGWS